jgi:hypothetical protein
MRHAQPAESWGTTPDAPLLAARLETLLQDLNPAMVLRALGLGAILQAYIAPAVPFDLAAALLANQRTAPRAPQLLAGPFLAAPATASDGSWAAHVGLQQLLGHCVNPEPPAPSPGAPWRRATRRWRACRLRPPRPWQRSRPP